MIFEINLLFTWWTLRVPEECHGANGLTGPVTGFAPYFNR